MNDDLEFDYEAIPKSDIIHIGTYMGMGSTDSSVFEYNIFRLAITTCLTLEGELMSNYFVGWTPIKETRSLVTMLVDLFLVGFIDHFGMTDAMVLDDRWFMLEDSEVSLVGERVGEVGDFDTILVESSETEEEPLDSIWENEIKIALERNDE